MVKVVLKEAKDVDSAILLALKDLGESNRDNCIIKIIEEGTKGFFGFGAKTAKVSVALKQDNKKTAVQFLKEILLSMNIVCDIKCEIRDRNMYIDLKGEKVSILIGKRGFTLDSLQFLTNLAVNKGEGNYVNIILDIENYREHRKEALENLAINLGKKALRTRKPVILEPMSSYERRIIHMVLQNDKTLKTSSEGKEPYRYIVISAV